MPDCRARRSWRSVRVVLMPLAVGAAAWILTTALSATGEVRQQPDTTRPAVGQVAAPTPTAKVTLSDQEIEQFLLKAKVLKTKSASKGITGTSHATMSDGALTHDASIQTIDEEQARFESTTG